MTESEEALAAALAGISRLPEARIQVDSDLTWLCSGRPATSLNHVHSIALRGDSAAIDARIDTVQAAVSGGGALPVTWWIGPSTSPPDLATRLRAHGLTEDEPEFGMAVNVNGLPLPHGDVHEVTEAELDEWLGVMGRSYRWSNPRAIAAWNELYRGALGEGVRPWRHVLVRDAGAPVACASLATSGATGFVTNVGTVPEARGRGHGATATLAVVAIARRLGYRRATLTASVMGRGVYARLGFREDAYLERFISAGLSVGEAATPSPA